MGIYFSWIKEELIKYFPQDNPAAGFDLNQNNQLEENERIGDLNQDQFVDEKDLSTPVKVGDQFFVTHTVYPAARLDGNVLVRFKDSMSMEWSDELRRL